MEILQISVPWNQVDEGDMHTPGEYESLTQGLRISGKWQQVRRGEGERTGMREVSLQTENFQEFYRNSDFKS